MVSRLTEFCNRRELVNQTGHDIPEWPLVILKELTDNGIDACEEAEIAPNISVTVTKGGSIIVEDNGPGFPAKTINLFSITRSESVRAKPIAAQREASKATH